MDFGFSEEQREVQGLARQILSEQVTAERLAEFDEFRAERFDRDLWAQLAEAGLLGVAIEESFGGMGFGFTELAFFIEEAGRSIAPVPLIPHLVSAALPLQAFGDEALRQRWLPGVADGSVVLTAALMEPGNENPVLPETHAVADGEGFRVSGIKAAVPFARQADRILMAATTQQGPVVFLLDPEQPGVSFTTVKYTTYEPQCEIKLDQVAIAAEAIVVGADRGTEVLRWLTERTMAALCLHQLGVTDQAMRMTASYTAERSQFGVPVATFQAVGHRAANCYIDVECLRLNAYQAASLLDGGNEASTEVQIAKYWAGEVGHRVSYAAQHLHGGMGIDRDYPLWRFCLWARHNELMLGGSASQLAQLGQRIAAGEAYCQ